MKLKERKDGEKRTFKFKNVQILLDNFDFYTCV